MWDRPYEANAPAKLETVPPGQDVDIEGQGEILRIDARPAPGEREIKLDSNNLVSDEIFKTLPSPYEVDMYGSSPNKIAITFDDGPDPEWTPKILDVLKEKGVKATFFLIGVEAQKYPGITKRVYNEGHEIGNHTFTHPDISNISKRYFEVELNLTERFFEGKLGVKPVLFRPPYSIDQEPDTADQVRPLELAQDLGYITVGDKVDPNDWHDNPRRSGERDRQRRAGQSAALRAEQSGLRQHHSAARWRRRPPRNGEGAATDHRRLEGPRLRNRAGLGVDGQDPR